MNQRLHEAITDFMGYTHVAHKYLSNFFLEFRETTKDCFKLKKT